MFAEFNTDNWPILCVDLIDTPNEYTFNLYLETLDYYLNNPQQFKFVINFLNLKSLPVKYVHRMVKFNKENKIRMKNKIKETMIICPKKYVKLINLGLGLIKPSNPVRISDSVTSDTYNSFYQDEIEPKNSVIINYE